MSKQNHTAATLTVNRQTKHRLEQFSRQLQSSPDQIAEEALNQFLDYEEWKEAEIKKGLADVAAGRLVPHERVRAWANSLGTDNELPLPLSNT